MTSALFILAGLALLYLGAEGLVRGSASAALRFGLSPLVVGLTIVAWGTSMPELIVSANAVLAGSGAIAAGNVVGSNILNIGLVLGIAALIFPIRIQFQLVRIDVPIAIGVSAIAVLFLWNGRIAFAEAALLAAAAVAYTAGSVIFAKRTTTAEIDAEFAESMPAKSSRPLWLDLAMIAGGLAVLAIGSKLLVDGAVTLARGLGIGEAIIGLTIVAVGTSTPELAASIIAAVRREPDIAAGNIVGSNIFNVLGILGISGMIGPIDANGVTAVDLGVMLGLQILILPLMWSGFVLGRREGALLLSIYAAYLVWIWP